jgi:hypothetical protein
MFTRNQRFDFGWGLVVKEQRYWCKYGRVRVISTGARFDQQGDEIARAPGLAFASEIHLQVT